MKDKQNHSKILKDIDISIENPLNNITSFKIKNLPDKDHSHLKDQPSLEMFDSYSYKNNLEIRTNFSNETISRPVSIDQSFSKNISISPSKKNFHANQIKRFENDDKNKHYTYSQLNPALENLINQVRNVLPSDSYSKTDETFSKRQPSFQIPGASELLSSVSRKYTQEYLNEKSSILNYSKLRTKSAGNPTSKNLKYKNSNIPNSCCINLYNNIRQIRGIFVLQKPIKQKKFIECLNAFSKIKFVSTQISIRQGKDIRYYTQISIKFFFFLNFFLDNFKELIIVISY